MLAVSLVLTSASLAQDLLSYLGSREAPLELVPFGVGDGIASLDADLEASLPSWFSSSVLLLCSILLFSISLDKRKFGDRHTPRWWGLTIIFCLMSADEVASMHEHLIEPLRSLLNTGGILYFAWVVFGVPLVLVFVIAYLRFLFDLRPKKVRRWFVLAGILYVAGALGMEMIGGLQADLNGEDNLTYTLITATEECLEMVGAVVFSYALLIYINGNRSREA